MGRRGPAKGHGGRPRKGVSTSHSKGYGRKTVGPKGKGRRVYAHRAAVGLTKPAKGRRTVPKKVVHHKDGRKSNNARSNLRVMPSRGSRSHTAHHNRKKH